MGNSSPLAVLYIPGNSHRHNLFNQKILLLLSTENGAQMWVVV